MNAVKWALSLVNGPRRKKTCPRGFRQSVAQTRLLSYRDYLEKIIFVCCKLRYGAFQKAKNKCADQTARMRRLVCAFVICNPLETGFLDTKPK